jgi:hypothetical protein
MGAIPTNPEQRARWLAEIIEAVEGMLDGWARQYARRGLRVAGVSLERPEDEVPVVLVFLEHEGVEGERVARFDLDGSQPNSTAGPIATGDAG